MKNIYGRLFALAAILPVLLACTVASPRSPKRKPVRWIMVEKPVGDVVPNGWNGNGQIDPRSTMVTLQPLYAEDVNWEVVVDPHDFYVEILEISPVQAAPGETVSAKVRVGHSRESELYRLTARASHSDVTIVGDNDKTVRGNAAVAFSFTSYSPGRAGIAIDVERLERRTR